MRAVVVKPRDPNTIHMREMADPPMAADQVAVRVLRVGLCGTDAEINRGLYGEAPEHEEFLILGHENFGVVEDVGRNAKRFKPGDFVVATVRRPCGVCFNCRHGENDMCTSGQYQERGIRRRHGYLAEYYVESPQWLNRIPKSAADIAVLLEPTSVVEKGIDHAFRIQQRFKWKPASALVLGAGPIGLLAAAVLRLRGLAVHVVAGEHPTELRATLAVKMAATYHSVANRTLADLRKDLPPIDLAIEATGSASVAFDALPLLGPNGVLCLLSVTGGNTQASEPIDRINRQLVLGNQVVFGSVNANPRHFRIGVKDLSAMQKAWPGLLTQMITSRLRWTEYRDWFEDRRADDIKTVLEVGPTKPPAR